MKPTEHQGSHPPRSSEAADRARLEKIGRAWIERMAKPMQIRTLLLNGLSINEVAKKVGVAPSIVQIELKRLNDSEEKTKTFRMLAEFFAEHPEKSYKPRMEDLGEIVQLLASWNADAVSRLAADLKSGNLRKVYEQASEVTPAVIIHPNPSGWVPTAQLPPDVADAVRAAGAIRQRTRRAKMSEAERAEERAKTAARMREKRNRSQETGRSTPPNGELYAARPDRKESAPAFIGRVYGSAGWLTGEFTRADLRKVDSSALIGLENWERKHGRATLNLPTVKERNDKVLERDPETLTKAERQEQGRIRLSRQHHEYGSVSALKDPKKEDNRSTPPDGQLYANRPDRKENVPAFIERVYGGAGWLNGEFTRADLRKIDPAAEMALRNWEHSRQRRADLLLPTKQQVNDRLIASGAPIETDDQRETARRRAAAWRRRHRSLE